MGDDVTEIVDLTSPDDGGKQQQRPTAAGAGGKRRRSEAADDGTVDLAAEEEAEARSRIMAFARKVNAERAAGVGGALAGLQLGGAEGAPPAQEPAAAGGGGDEGKAEGDGGEAAVVPPANRLLAQLHAERMARLKQRPQPGEQQQQQQQQAVARPAAPPAQRAPASQPPSAGPGTHRQQQQQGTGRLSLLTYNVWFREDLHVEARMGAIGRIIEERAPDFVCLQEMTPYIYQLLASQPWWRGYGASPCPPGAPYFTTLLWRTATVLRPSQLAEAPFENSRMGRDIKSVAGVVGGLPVRVATSHLESATGWQADQQNSAQRVAQLKQAAALLDRAPEPDVLLAGDMNWGPNDGQPPLPGGWSDAWQHLYPGEAGLTYDPKSNPMLKPNSRLRRRLDRVFAKLQRWRLHSMELVGRDPLPGLQFEGRQVLPSDHFGLLLSLRPA